MRIAIVGGGIVGLTLARELLTRRPDARLTVLEKEPRLGVHQTGHNSGVVHAGLYYQPGSLKAELCSRGRGLLRDFCSEHAIPYAESGKVVVARSQGEVAALAEIHRRAEANGVPGLAWLDAPGLREIEPYAVGVAAVHSPATAVVDFGRVAEAAAHDVRRAGGEIRVSAEVTAIRHASDAVRVQVAGGDDLIVDHLVVCAGLQSDRVAALAGATPDPAIVPFMGMYYALRPERRNLVRSLIYPVPDPRYPFLGIHLTRTINGDVLVGPNAVLALARESYRPLRFSFSDSRDTLRWSGFRAMAREHWRQGAREAFGAVSRRAFAAAAREYVPAITDDDLVRDGVGVRAQAVWADGRLADDFVLNEHGPITIVRNAPSPAATSSLAIAEYLADRVLGSAPRVT